MSDRDDRNPQLVWTETGEPRSGRYGDVYFSAEDGLAESRAVFLTGCGLPEAWSGRNRFTVAELGFGTGLNIAALLNLWQRHRPPNARLTVFSVEAYPLNRDEARRALSAWPKIADAGEALLNRWPAATPGFHRLDLPEFGAVLDLAVGEVDWALNQWSGQADAWFLDGFAPSTNPAMWSSTVLDAIAARSAPDARIATFTVAGAVRRGLSERGFVVDKRPGHGRKRERLEARGTGPSLSRRSPSVAVIGAGIAGASAARALMAQGISPVVIESATPGAGASGFPAALVTPRFDLGDTTVAALFAQALERARSLYDPLPGAVIADGVVQLPATDRDHRRFERVAEQPIWPTDEMTMLDADAVSRRLDETVDQPALSMENAFVVAPRRIVPAWLEGCDLIPCEVADVRAGTAGWQIRAASGEVVCEVEAVVLCAGAGMSHLAPALDLNPVRGQAEWTADGTTSAIAWGGYVAPLAEGGFLFGATHDRGDRDTRVRSEDTRRNLETLAARLPRRATSLSETALQSRAAIRATTRDRLPVADAVPGSPGLFVIGGLGSRGFCLAPLLGEHVAALISGSPSPLPAAVAARITYARPALARATPEDEVSGGGFLQEPV